MPSSSFHTKCVVSVLLLACVGMAAAQPAPAMVPQPDLQFMVVDNTHGRPMRGDQADSFMMAELWKEHDRRVWLARFHFTVADSYPYGGPEKPGDTKQWMLGGVPLKLKGRAHVRMDLIDCYCRDAYVEVLRDDERMRIDLPTTPEERWALLQQMLERNAEHASPEVFRFRPGRFTYAELAADPTFHRMEARLAARTSTDAQQAYRDEVWRKEMRAVSKGWSTDIHRAQEPNTSAHPGRSYALGASNGSQVRAPNDTARHTFTLETDGLRTGPVSIVIDRDPNYAHHLLEFPASGPGTRFELYLQDSTGVPSETVTLRVDMPAEGETSKWVDVTELPSGAYTAYLTWGEHQSVFYLVLGR